MYHRSDTVTRAYRALAGTAARQPLTLRGPCYTSSSPTTTPPTAAATADQQAWLSPWFHTVPPDHPAHVAWTRTPTATWTFTNERADPDSVAMEYNRCEQHRARPQEAP